MYGKKSPTKKRSCYKMKGKSPMMKALIGNQHRLPEELKAKIIASPAKMFKNKKQEAISHAQAVILYVLRVNLENHQLETIKKDITEHNITERPLTTLLT